MLARSIALRIVRSWLSDSPTVRDAPLPHFVQNVSADSKERVHCRHTRASCICSISKKTTLIIQKHPLNKKLTREFLQSTRHTSAVEVVLISQFIAPFVSLHLAEARAIVGDELLTFAYVLHCSNVYCAAIVCGDDVRHAGVIEE